MSESGIDPEDREIIEGDATEVEDADDEERQSGRLEERERRQHSQQQHGDEFAVDTERG